MGPTPLAQLTVRSWGRGTRPRPQLMRPSSTQASIIPDLVRTGAISDQSSTSQEQWDSMPSASPTGALNS